MKTHNMYLPERFQIDSTGWLRKLGQPLEKQNDLLEMVKSAEECTKSSDSLKWENFTLYAGNNFYCFLEGHFKEAAKDWNRLVREARNYFRDELFEDLVERLNENGLSTRIALDIEGIVMMFLVERSFQERLGDQGFSQFATLFSLLEDGHIPCGWKGPMPKNEGEKPVDFSKGKILIW